MLLLYFANETLSDPLLNNDFFFIIIIIIIIIIITPKRNKIPQKARNLLVHIVELSRAVVKVDIKVKK